MQSRTYHSAAELAQEAESARTETMDDSDQVGISHSQDVTHGSLSSTGTAISSDDTQGHELPPTVVAINPRPGKSSRKTSIADDIQARVQQTTRIRQQEADRQKAAARAAQAAQALQEEATRIAEQVARSATAAGHPSEVYVPTFEIPANMSPDDADPDMSVLYQPGAYAPRLNKCLFRLVEFRVSTKYAIHRNRSVQTRQIWGGEVPYHIRRHFPYVNPTLASESATLSQQAVFAASTATCPAIPVTGKGQSTRTGDATSGSDGGAGGASNESSASGHHNLFSTPLITPANATSSTRASAIASASLTEYTTCPYLYTDDSDIVAMLQHTGVRILRSVPPSAVGLSVICRILPALPYYSSTESGGLVSRDWTQPYPRCTLQLVRVELMEKGNFFQAYKRKKLPTDGRRPRSEIRLVMMQDRGDSAVTQVPYALSSRSVAGLYPKERCFPDAGLTFTTSNEPCLVYTPEGMADKHVSPSLWTAKQLQESVFYFEAYPAAYQHHLALQSLTGPTTDTLLASSTTSSSTSSSSPSSASPATSSSSSSTSTSSTSSSGLGMTDTTSPSSSRAPSPPTAPSTDISNPNNIYNSSTHNEFAASSVAALLARKYAPLTPTTTAPEPSTQTRQPVRYELSCDGVDPTTGYPTYQWARVLTQFPQSRSAPIVFSPVEASSLVQQLADMLKISTDASAVLASGGKPNTDSATPPTSNKKARTSKGAAKPVTPTSTTTSSAPVGLTASALAGFSKKNSDLLATYYTALAAQQNQQQQSINGSSSTTSSGATESKPVTSDTISSILSAYDQTAPLPLTQVEVLHSKLDWSQIVWGPSTVTFTGVANTSNLSHAQSQEGVTVHQDGSIQYSGLATLQVIPISHPATPTNAIAHAFAQGQQQQQQEKKMSSQESHPFYMQTGTGVVGLLGPSTIADVITATGTCGKPPQVPSPSGSGKGSGRPNASVSLNGGSMVDA